MTNGASKPPIGPRVAPQRAAKRPRGSSAGRRGVPSSPWSGTGPFRRRSARRAPGRGVAASIDLSREESGSSRRVRSRGVLLFLEVAFQLRGFASTAASSHVSLVGRIVHCARTNDGTYRVGIQLVVVPPNDRAILERLLEP